MLKNTRGFALVDILIGTVILAVALTGLAFAYRQSTVTTVSARNHNQAIYLAHQALEKLKVNDNADATAGKAWATTGPISLTVANVNYSISTMSPAIAEVLMITNLVPVQATVSWTENSGSTPTSRNVSVVGYYYLK